MADMRLDQWEVQAPLPATAPQAPASSGRSREEIAIGLARDPAFKQLSPERQQVVFQEAARQAGAHPVPQVASRTLDTLPPEIKTTDGNVYEVDVPESGASSKSLLSRAGDVPVAAASPVGAAIALADRMSGQGNPNAMRMSEVPAVLLHGLNTAAMGIPKAVYESQPAAANSPIGARLSNYGYAPGTEAPRQFPSAVTSQGRTAQGMAEMAGYAVPFNAASQGVGGVTRAVPAVAQFAAQHPALERAAIGGVAGAISNLPKSNEYLPRAVGGAVANVVIPPVIQRAFKLFEKTPPGKILSDAEFQTLAHKVRQAAGGGKLAAGIEFDQGVNEAVTKNPTVATPATDFITSLKSEMQADKGFAEKVQQGMLRSAKQGNTTLMTMLQDDNAAAQATGRDLQNIKQTLQSVPSIDRALQRTYSLKGAPKAGGRFDATVSDADLGLIDHISDLRARILSAYPELNSEYANYSQFMDAYRTIAPRLRTASLENSILGKEKFGGRLQRQAASEVLPSEILQEIDKVRAQQDVAMQQMARTKEFHKVLKKLGYQALKGAAWSGGAGAVGAAGMGLYKALKD